ncbi:MAG: sel1 repeat family protein [Candidatus Rokubacteria bacterium]|nr:sel1 repeat family protein [Candidatus Rokubacteria bacterium]
MKCWAAAAGVLFSALLVSQAMPDLRACEVDRARRDFDVATALRECWRMAEHGYPDAQLILGVMYADGWGVPQDDREAVKWFRRAAEQGNAFAQFHLGSAYANGRGVPQHDREAMKWFRRAAEQGDILAQVNLGEMYAKGQGGPEDDLFAYFWFILAASRTDTGGWSGDLLKARDLVVNRLTPEQRAKAQDMARDWKPKPERPTGPTPGK